jgi:hypothetical protein
LSRPILIGWRVRYDNSQKRAWWWAMWLVTEESLGTIMVHHPPSPEWTHSRALWGGRCERMTQDTADSRISSLTTLLLFHLPRPVVAQ